MVTIRRVYVLLVCLISLQAAAWATIGLLRDLVTPANRPPIATTALQIAVVFIGLPIFLMHWLWAQHSAGEIDERGAALRRLYLYGTLTLFLAPIVLVLFDLLERVFGLLLGARPLAVLPRLSQTEAMAQDAVTFVVFAILWLYHRRIVAKDARIVPEKETSSAFRRLYIFLFNGLGLTFLLFGCIAVLQWLFAQVGAPFVLTTDKRRLADGFAEVVIGLAVWLPFWLVAQRAFAGDDEEERASLTRKVYLYLVVFITVLAAVSVAATILAGIFRALLGLTPQGDLRETLPVLIVLTIAWLYHSVVVRRDAAHAGEAPRQAGIRRLYNYLVAGVGLAAFLIGVGGDISVVIRTLSEGAMSNALKEMLAWFTAAIIAGLPVWLLPWRRVQSDALEANETGAAERRSTVRKIYLYVYLFAATMTILVTLIYILFRFLSIVLGERFTGNLLSDIGHALAYALIGASVWAYHGWALRQDNQATQQERRARLATLRVAVLDAGDATFNTSLAEHLQREIPGLTFETIDPANIANKIGEARIIVRPAAMAQQPLRTEILSALANSPAHKLLVPLAGNGWQWVGIEQTNIETMARQTARAIKRIIAGEEPDAGQTINPLVWIAVGAIVLVLLCFLVSVVPSLFLAVAD